MNPILFASELMLISIAMMAFVIFWDLYRTKDGPLRLIMMWYMVSEIIVYLGSGIFFWMSLNGYTHMNVVAFSLLVLPTKCIIKLVLFFWIRKNDGL